jgi:ubiquinone/menaquinone biosynthesis C-methylase UbiE
MDVKNYKPEAYWDQVAESISARDDMKIMAGDDEPYYRYKRKLFLDLLGEINFANKKVLEVGSGPGGNLDFLTSKGCAEIAGADVSERMILLSRRILQNKNVRVHKIDGCSLPFDDNYFDLVFTSTVLQHNTDEVQLKELIENICRVSKSEVIIFERIEKKISGHETNLGRPVEYYKMLFGEYGFDLVKTEFLPIQASYLACGIIRKLFNKKDRREGEPISRLSGVLQAGVLPATSIIDKLIPSKRDLAMLVFKKNGGSKKGAESWS